MSRIESPPPRGRSHTLYSWTNASHVESGEITYGRSSGSVSPTVHEYVASTHRNSRSLAVNWIDRSPSMNRKVEKGSFTGS